MVFADDAFDGLGGLGAAPDARFAFVDEVMGARGGFEGVDVGRPGVDGAIDEVVVVGGAELVRADGFEAGVGGLPLFGEFDGDFVVARCGFDEANEGGSAVQQRRRPLR